ncbi:hypothetical protein Lcho_3587 [Leptothrix cholodnii SP-6]|uniref:Uncharacterized protein n=1 Tax=Leptothrix cholodnii (strain ATCC 51168 / LMG 8142 / SP-6) TaxID=395495 RepID=B1Y4E0_LEPCP|nr:hypothetical protein Lcho_3587 [Leptothrix cholodnii SP-6]
MDCDVVIVGAGMSQARRAWACLPRIGTLPNGDD